MNSTRRKQIEKVSAELRDLAGKLNDIREQVEALRDEEQEAYDNMPESFQNGDRGQVAQEAISNMDSAIDLIADLEEAADYLDGAAQ